MGSHIDLTRDYWDPNIQTSKLKRPIDKYHIWSLNLKLDKFYLKEERFEEISGVHSKQYQGGGKVSFQ